MAFLRHHCYQFVLFTGTRSVQHVPAQQQRRARRLLRAARCGKGSLRAASGLVARRDGLYGAVGKGRGEHLLPSGSGADLLHRAVPGAAGQYRCRYQR